MHSTTQTEEDISIEGMAEGIRTSRNFILFLSDGVLSRPYVQFEIRCALKLRKPFILIHEADERHHPCDFAKELDAAPTDLKSVLSSHESLAWRRRHFEQKSNPCKIRLDPAKANYKFSHH